MTQLTALAEKVEEAEGASRRGTCLLCASACRGHQMGHPDQWAPEAGSVAYLLNLAAQVEAVKHSDNHLDVLVEIALFEAGDGWVAIRANAAGTKVICDGESGGEETFWPRDWTMGIHRLRSAAALRARAQAALSSEMTI